MGVLGMGVLGMGVLGMAAASKRPIAAFSVVLPGTYNFLEVLIGLTIRRAFCSEA